MKQISNIIGKSLLITASSFMAIGLNSFLDGASPYVLLGLGFVMVVGSFVFFKIGA
jgi:hypothetical protein